MHTAHPQAPNTSRQPSGARLRARLAQLSACLALAGLAHGAGAFEQPVDGVHKDRIDWGVMMDLSGPTSYGQVPWVNGFKDHMRKVNEAGGIHNRKINVMAEDDRYDASLDRINYEKLANQTPVLGISGVGNSSAQVALMPSIRRGKVPIVGTYVTTKAAVEPPTPMFYGGFCGYKEMAQTAVGFFGETLKLKAPKVAVVHLDVASGKEYYDAVETEVKRLGGAVKSMPIKVTAADTTAQVLDIIAMKPDYVTVHGVANTVILLMRSLQQYGLKIPVVGITYLGTPVVYAALGAEIGSNFYFVSCFTPGGIDEPGGPRELSAFADKYGNGAMKDDINYVAGWVVGQIAAESISRAGPEPTREKLVESMSKGFEVDTKGLAPQIKYTKDDHLGVVLLRPYTYDYQAKRYKAFGKYSDYQKFVR